MYVRYTKRIVTTSTRRVVRLCWLLGVVGVLLTACGSSSATQGSVATPGPSARQTVTQSIFHTPITYVALGASDAVGVGSNDPSEQGYVPLIASRLPRGSHELDLGVSGIQLHQALGQELPLALSTGPQLITIWLVANDFVGGVSYQNYLSDLNTLLSQLHTRTQARIVMANLPDLTLLPAFSMQTSAQKSRMLRSIAQWNQGIAEVAKRYHVALLNLFQDGSDITAHPQYISGDGFHPSAQGYARLAALFWQVIQTP